MRTRLILDSSLSIIHDYSSKSISNCKFFVYAETAKRSLTSSTNFFKLTLLKLSGIWTFVLCDIIKSNNRFKKDNSNFAEFRQGNNY